MVDDNDLLSQQYDLIGDSRWPTAYNEVVVVVDKYNQISDYLQFVLGLRKPSEVADAIVNGDKFAEKNFTVDELLSIEYRIMTGSDYFHQNQDGTWTETSTVQGQTKIDFVESNSVPVKVVGVVRPKKDVDAASIVGIVGYKKELVEYLSNRANQSPIAVAQKASQDKNVVTGESLNETEYRSFLRRLGVADLSKPTSIRVYANSFKDKEYFAELVAGFEKETGKTIKYVDTLSVIMGFVETMMEVVTGVLVAFASISLIVSSIMIAIIVYTSVLERKKEIGVSRSIGASKGSISKVFVAESGIIGILSGGLGILTAYILTVIANLILTLTTEINIAISFVWWQPLAMFLISIVLAVVAGVVPAWIASRKDPVECLRTE
jgi:putative ABC transport system permease protein